MSTKKQTVIKAIPTPAKNSVFQDLCNLATRCTDYQTALKIDEAIAETKQGKECKELLKQYYESLITFAEFQSAFIHTCFKQDQEKTLAEFHEEINRSM